MSFPFDISDDIGPVSTSLSSREDSSSTLAPPVVMSTQLPDVHLAALPFPMDVMSGGSDGVLGRKPLIPLTDVTPPSDASSNASVLNSLLGGTSSPVLMSSSLPIPDGFTMRLRVTPLPFGSVPMVSVYRETNGDLETALHVEVMIIFFLFSSGVMM